MLIHTIRSLIANIYLIENENGIVIVDTGFWNAAQEVLRTIEQIGRTPREVRLIFLTHVHMDHAGSAAELRQQTGAPIALHRADAPKARAGKHNMPHGRGIGGILFERAFNLSGLQMKYKAFEPDIFLQEGDTLREFGLDARVIHTPGHTRGSLSLWLENRDMLIGDALINQVRVGMPMYGEEIAMAYASLRKIRALCPRVLYSGHGKPFTGDDVARYCESKHLT